MPRLPHTMKVYISDSAQTSFHCDESHEGEDDHLLDFRSRRMTIGEMMGVISDHWKNFHEDEGKCERCGK